MSRQPSYPSPHQPSPPGTSPIQTTSTSGSSDYQNQLLNVCARNRWLTPNYEYFSDRRGGRTAWSCGVTIPGQNLQTVKARFWYDGAYVNNAKEDAAQVMLQQLGMVPRPGGQPPQYAQQTQQPQSPPSQQRRAYGPINS